MECPLCKSAKTQRNGTGTSNGKRHQKYICTTCGHHFKDYDRLSTKYKRVIIIPDTHCGHFTGLTPTEFQNPNKPFHDYRQESWTWFSNVVELMKPFDVCIYNGDLMDGKGEKNGGREILYPDMFDQVRMAVAIHHKINPVKAIVVKGTPYHTGQVVDWEDDFADRIGAKTYERFLGDIAGKVFDVRHKIGRSGVPYGRVAPLSRQIVWSRLREEKQGVHADIIIRSHVHYYLYIEESGIIAITTPALEGHSAFGSRQCDGEVDLGVLILDIYPDGRVLHHAFLPQLETLKPHLVEI